MHSSNENIRYFDRSDGNVLLDGGYWMLFWYGSKGLTHLQQYQKQAICVPPSFISK